MIMFASRTTRLFVVMLLLSVSTATSALESAPFFECGGCDEMQMRQAALDEPGLGVRIVYNLDAAAMLKFRVFEDAQCASEDDSEAASVAIPGCASPGIRQVEALPVDASLTLPFTAMLGMHVNVPPFVETGKVSMPMSLVNEQLAAPQAPFDPYRVAFDRYSGDSYQRFQAAAAGVISNEKLMRQLNPPIASLIFDVWTPIRLARITDGSTPEPIALAPRFAIDEFIVDFVSDEQRALVSMRFTSADMGILQARDETGVLLPAREDLETDRFERRFSGPGALDSANRLGSFLQRNASIQFVEFDSECEPAYLFTCTNAPDGRACRIDCSP
jgi:hypothetical protein